MSEHAQLAALAELDRLLDANGLEYWVFGGWAVDFHLARVTRDHSDLDLAVWAVDRERIDSLLLANGWTRAPKPGEDGFTGYARESVRLELAFLARGESGEVYTPLHEGRGEWPAGAFGEDSAEIRGVRARVIGLRALRADKSQTQPDPRVAAKDRADIASLAALG